MPFEDDFSRHVDQVKARLPHIRGEEATKQALVVPLLSVLGYDVYDPREVAPEYIADFAKKKSNGQMEKIDYVVRINGEPAIFVECKAADVGLDGHDAQLARYFNSTPSVRVAILTNGVRLQVFTDLQQRNIMDEKPWMDFDLRNAKQAEVDALKRFRKTDFSPDQVIGLAEEMLYYNVLVGFMSSQLRDPGEPFVRFVAGEMPGKPRVDKKLVDRLTPILRKAIHASIVDHVARSFSREPEVEAFAPSAAPAAALSTPPSGSALAAAGGQTLAESQAREGVVTTAEELEAWNLVCKIVREKHPDGALSFRDAKAYFTIMQKNLRKWFMRLGVEKQPYWVSFRHIKPEEGRNLCPGVEVGDGASVGDCRVMVKTVADIVKLKALVLAAYEAEAARVVVEMEADDGAALN